MKKKGSEERERRKRGREELNRENTTQGSNCVNMYEYIVHGSVYIIAQMWKSTPANLSCV